MAITEEKAQRIAEEYAKIDYKEKVAPLIEVGYSPNYARALGLKLYDNVRVKAAIDKIRANVSQETGITITWVVNNLKKVAERCLNASPVLDCNGNENGEWQFDSGGANRALQLLGMHVGAFEADNAQKKPDVRVFSHTELKQLVLDNDKRDAEILDISQGLAV